MCIGGDTLLTLRCRERDNIEACQERLTNGIHGGDDDGTFFGRFERDFRGPGHEQRVQCTAKSGNIKGEKLESLGDVPGCHADRPNGHKAADPDGGQPALAAGIGPVATHQSRDDGDGRLAGGQVVDLADGVAVVVRLEVEVERLAVGDHRLVEDEVQADEGVPMPALEDVGDRPAVELDLGGLRASFRDPAACQGDLVRCQKPRRVLGIGTGREHGDAEESDGKGNAAAHYKEPTPTGQAIDSVEIRVTGCLEVAGKHLSMS